MFRSLTMLAFTLAMPAAQVSADEQDGLVRLPGQGELRDRDNPDRAGVDRFKSGGGLFISFDGDADGTITLEEVRAALPVAFSQADANGDGNLSALEQQDWAKSLPTRDDSLANPTRFDPNLDRRVDLEEFTTVIEALYADYLNEDTGLLQLADLKAPKQRKTRRERAAEDILQERAEAERRRQGRVER
ncbi:MAG: hypothetical protein AAGH90_08100 [Pseudomonadota bacterium]